MTETTGNAASADGERSRKIALIQERCQEILGKLIQNSSSLVFASLSLVDGRTFAHANGSRETGGARIAAITTSMLGLSESFAKEALSGSCTHTIIAVDSGSIVTVRVPSQKRVFALSVCADLSENMAMVLRRTLDTAAALAQVIDQHQ